MVTKATDEPKPETKPDVLPALTMKLTAELIETYKAELAALEEIKKQLKPVADRTDALHAHIFGLMKKCKKQVRSLGDHHLKIVAKKNSVQWKTELAKRIASKELAQIESAVGTTDTLIIS